MILGIRRCTGDDRGAGLVVGIAVMFAFTFLGLVWLARDVDRAVSNRSAAQAIAFQSARAGAQAAVVPGLRSGDQPIVDDAAAHAAASRTAEALFASYEVSGRITSIAVGVDDVTVAVAIDDDGHTATGIGTVRAARAP